VIRVKISTLANQNRGLEAITETQKAFSLCVGVGVVGADFWIFIVILIG